MATNSGYHRQRPKRLPCKWVLKPQAQQHSPAARRRLPDPAAGDPEEEARAAVSSRVMTSCLPASSSVMSSSMSAVSGVSGVSGVSRKSGVSGASKESSRQSPSSRLSSTHSCRFSSRFSMTEKLDASSPCHQTQIRHNLTQMHHHQIQARHTLQLHRLKPRLPFNRIHTRHNRTQTRDTLQPQIADKLLLQPDTNKSQPDTNTSQPDKNTS